jgi:sulfite exporter TauE/SafE
MSTTTLITAMLMGITGSLHCAGMCGPIMLVMPFRMLDGYKKWLGLFLYHSGRISVYALMGWLLYSFKSFFDPHWQQYVSIGFGALLMIIGLISFAGNTSMLRLPWATWVQHRLARVMAKPGMHMLLATGALNGLLPCGLVYMALSLSIAAPTAGMAITSMYAFGMGTVPMLLAITLLGSRIPAPAQQRVKKMVPVVLFVFAGLFMVRGMNLGIPYLSPEIKTESGQVKASCCHKATIKP